MTSPPAANDQAADNLSLSTRRRRRWAAWVVAVLTVLWLLHTATQYFVLGVDRTPFMRHKVQSGFEPWAGWRTLLGVHVAAAIAAMATGGVAFVLGVLKARWTLHRLAGRTYAVAVVVSAAAGFPLAFTATGGVPATVGFLILNGVWLATAAATYLLARRRDIARHRAWAVRSYAVTIANMTLHLLTASLTGPLDSRAAAYTVAVWLCWPVNLCVAEIVLRARVRLTRSQNERVAQNERQPWETSDLASGVMRCNDGTTDSD